MQEKVNQIITQIKSKYADIDTILLFGSATGDSWTPKSDIDIFLIDNNLQDSRTDLNLDGITIEIQKDNFANLAKDIENERGKLLNRNVATMIATSTVITNHSTAELEQLKSLADSVLKSKPTFTDEDVEMWHYSIADYLAKAEKDITRNDPIAFYLDSHYVIQNALELCLATHGAYLPQPKNLSHLLAVIDPTLLQVIKDYLSAPDLDSKYQAISKLR